MRTSIPILLLVAFSLAAFQPGGNGCKDLPPSAFYIRMQQRPDAVVIDTRLAEKYRRERIPGARPAPRKKMLQALADSLSPGLPLMVYCDHDDRSKTACRILTREMDFSNVYRLKGGFLSWKKQNLPVDTTVIQAGWR
jgi:rhodanese-related sulfurtransferase